MSRVSTNCLQELYKGLTNLTGHSDESLLAIKQKIAEHVDSIARKITPELARDPLFRRLNAEEKALIIKKLVGQNYKKSVDSHLDSVNKSVTEMVRLSNLTPKQIYDEMYSRRGNANGVQVENNINANINRLSTTVEEVASLLNKGFSDNKEESLKFIKAFYLYDEGIRDGRSGYEKYNKYLKAIDALKKEYDSIAEKHGVFDSSAVKMFDVRMDKTKQMNHEYKGMKSYKAVANEALDSEHVSLESFYNGWLSKDNLQAIPKADIPNAIKQLNNSSLKNLRDYAEKELISILKSREAGVDKYGEIKKYNMFKEKKLEFSGSLGAEWFYSNFGSDASNISVLAGRVRALALEGAMTDTFGSNWDGMFSDLLKIKQKQIADVPEADKSSRHITAIGDGLEYLKHGSESTENSWVDTITSSSKNTLLPFIFSGSGTKALIVEPFQTLESIRSKYGAVEASRYLGGLFKQALPEYLNQFESTKGLLKSFGYKENEVRKIFKQAATNAHAHSLSFISNDLTGTQRRLVYASKKFSDIMSAVTGLHVFDNIRRTEAQVLEATHLTMLSDAFREGRIKADELASQYGISPKDAELFFGAEVMAGAHGERFHKLSDFAHFDKNNPDALFEIDENARRMMRIFESFTQAESNNVSNSGRDIRTLTFTGELEASINKPTTIPAKLFLEMKRAVFLGTRPAYASVFNNYENWKRLSGTSAVSFALNTVALQLAAGFAYYKFAEFLDGKESKETWKTVLDSSLSILPPHVERFFQSEIRNQPLTQTIPVIRSLKPVYDGVVGAATLNGDRFAKAVNDEMRNLRLNIPGIRAMQRQFEVNIANYLDAILGSETEQQKQKEYNRFIKNN